MSQPRTDEPSAAPPVDPPRFGEGLAWAALYAGVMACLQAQIPNPLDSDSAYHAMVGRLLAREGPLTAMPWTPFSLMAEHYADKELLFHLLFVPLAWLDWRFASQIVGVVGGAAALSCAWFVLRSERIPWAGTWPLLSLTGSVLFLFRFCQVRPHLLSIALATIFLWASARQKHVALVTVSMLFPLSYVAFWQIPALLLVAVAVARLACGRRVDAWVWLIVGGGVLLGLLVHPNAMNVIRVNWMHMVDVLFQGSWGARADVELGGEFAPYPLVGWIQALSFSCLLVLVASVAQVSRKRRDVFPLAVTLAAVGFGILTVRTARFAEYFVPFSTIAGAIAVHRLVSRTRLVRALAVGALWATAAWSAWVQPNLFDQWRSWADEMPANVAERLAVELPAGARVFTPDWTKTGVLMVTLPERYFMVQLDPTFFLVWNRALYRDWFNVSHEAPRGAARFIRERFGTRYVLAPNGPQWGPLFARLTSERGVRTVLVSESWVLFDLGT